jgi:hypothetical protein
VPKGILMLQEKYVLDETLPVCTKMVVVIEVFVVFPSLSRQIPE